MQKKISFYHENSTMKNYFLWNINYIYLQPIKIYNDVQFTLFIFGSHCDIKQMKKLYASEFYNFSGRGDNVWLSPKGCAMFSLQLHIDLQCYIAQHISLLQHIVSLALVSGIHSISGYEVTRIELN